MKLTKKQKILVGIGTFWPIVYIPIFVVFIFAMVAGSALEPGRGGDLGPLFGIGFLIIFVLHMFTVFLSLGMTVFHVIHAVKNESLESNMRIVWIVLFFFAGMIAEPIYFYLEVWKEKPDVTELNHLPPPPASVDYTHDYRTGTYVPPNEPPDWR